MHNDDLIIGCQGFSIVSIATTSNVLKRKKER